jgi:hypothetical protein
MKLSQVKGTLPVLKLFFSSVGLSGFPITGFRLKKFCCKNLRYGTTLQA